MYRCNSNQPHTRWGSNTLKEMTKMNQEHLANCIGDSVPRALKHVGMHEVAKLLKTQNPDDIKKLQAILDSIEPKLDEAQARVVSVLKAASPEMTVEAEKYRKGLEHARYFVQAAKQTVKLVGQGKDALN